MKNSNFNLRYYRFFVDRFKFDRALEQIAIDFQRPWWQPFLKQRWLTFSVVLNTILESVFTTIVPIIIAWAYNTQNYWNLSWVFAVWLLINLLRFYTYRHELMLAGNVMYSVNLAANRFFLEVDPIHHVKRESGKIIAKVDRGVQGYNQLIDSLLINLIPFFTRVVTIVISLSAYNFLLGFVSLSSLLIIIFLNIVFTIYNSKVFLKHNIEATDEQKSIEVQNLNAVQFIRSVFNTSNQYRKLGLAGRKAIGADLTQYQAYFIIVLTVRILYILTTFAIALLCLSEANAGRITLVTGVSLVATYLSLSTQILWIGSNVKQLNKAYTHITNLFGFIREFGSNSFPVIDSSAGKSVAKLKTGQAGLSCMGLGIGYENKLVFEKFNWNIDFNPQSNNLYVLQGKSGEGKTSLLSALAGQLKPNSGLISVDGHDIYNVGDDIRRNLIAYQSQSPIAMRATLRDNLLFGIPDETVKVILDQELRQTLISLDIWDVFAEQRGLDTMIGEGGLNISGGQRQRLNFAGLVIRCKHLNPKLILLDEPTSSLDKYSEQLVMNHVYDMSKSRIVILVTHKSDSLSQDKAKFLSMNELLK